MDPGVINHKSVAAVANTYLQRIDIRSNLEVLRQYLPPTAEIFVAGGAIRNLVIEMIHGGAPPTYDIDLFIGGVAGDEPLIDRLSGLDVRSTELGGWRWHPPESVSAVRAPLSGRARPRASARAGDAPLHRARTGRCSAGR